MTLHRDRFEVARSQFGKALFRLREAIDLDETPMIRDAMIQRFEFTYELAWKAMYHWLRDHGENTPEMASAVFRAAFRCQLVEDPKVWEKTKDCRNETSHTYNEAKAIEVASFVRSYALHAFDALEFALQAL